jgi:hypothetical protein
MGSPGRKGQRTSRVLAGDATTGASPPALARGNSNESQLQYFNTPLLQHSITPALHYSSTPLLQHSNTPAARLSYFHPGNPWTSSLPPFQLQF